MSVSSTFATATSWHHCPFGPISNASTFVTASLAPAGSECKYTSRRISDESPMSADTVPKGVPTASSSVVVQCRKQCQLIAGSCREAHTRAN